MIVETEDVLKFGTLNFLDFIKSIRNEAEMFNVDRYLEEKNESVEQGE